MPPKRADARALAAKVFERHGIRIGEDDPAFALVTLNELILRKLMGELLEQVDQHIKAGLVDFTLTMQRVEGRAGKVRRRLEAVPRLEEGHLGQSRREGNRVCIRRCIGEKEAGERAFGFRSASRL